MKNRFFFWLSLSASCVILITNDVGNKERKDDESMGALVALGVFTAIAIVAVIVVVTAVAAIVAGVTDSTKEEEV